MDSTQEEKEWGQERREKRKREWCLGLGLCTCESTNGLFFHKPVQQPGSAKRVISQRLTASTSAEPSRRQTAGVRLSHQDHCLSCLYVALGREGEREKKLLFQVRFYHLFLTCEAFCGCWCARIQKPFSAADAIKPPQRWNVGDLRLSQHVEFCSVGGQQMCWAVGVKEEALFFKRQHLFIYLCTLIMYWLLPRFWREDMIPSAQLQQLGCYPNALLTCTENVLALSVNSP